MGTGVGCYNRGAMAEDFKEKDACLDERRRFLRESARGSLPLLVDWVAGRARGLARWVQPQAEPPKTSPPPQAAEAAPAETKELLDSHYQDFARDNPDSDRSSS